MGRPTGSRDKIRRKFISSFARQYLADHKIQVFSGDEQVLTPLGQTLYPIKLPNTRYNIGEQFIEQGETKKITKFEELRDLGFVVISISITGRQRWATGQKVMYELRRATETGDHLNKIPPDHHIEYDGYNKVARIMGPRAGPMGFGQWTKLNDKKNAPKGAGRKISIHNLSKRADDIMKKQMIRWSGQQEAPKPRHIPEVAFMITNSNEIVCFPNIPDMPSIMISGMKGCLTKDTLIEMPRNLTEYPKGVPIKDLIGKGPIHAYSYNIKKHKLELKLSDGVEFVKNADVYELELVNGIKIRATDDHPFLLMDGSYKKLKNIFWFSRPKKNGTTEHNYYMKDTKYVFSDKIRVFTRPESMKGDKSKYSVMIKKMKKNRGHAQHGCAVKSIKYVGKEDVYDIINVRDNHNFIANGMIVSNSGKCIVQDDKTDFIMDSEGRWVKISDRPKEVLVLNNNLKFEKAKVKNYYDRYVDEVIEIETRRNRKILLTPEHPILTITGWAEIQKLKKGDFIGVSGNYNLKNTSRMRRSTLTLIAYLLAAGTLDNTQLRFKGLQFDYDTKIDIIDCLADFGPQLVLRRNRIINKSKTKKNPLREYMNKLGLVGLSNKNKFIPNDILGLCNKQIALFLSKYFSANGHIKDRKIVFSAESPQIAHQLQHLLLRFGIIAAIYQIKPVQQKGKRKGKNRSHRISIKNAEGILKFQKLVKLVPKYKSQRLLRKCVEIEQITKNHCNHDIIPGGVWSITRPDDWFPAFQELGYYYKKSQLKNMDFNITKHNLKKIVKATKNKVLQKYAESDVLWDRIKTIKRHKKRYKVWDIEVDHPSHNFVANDIIVHNSFCLHSLVSRFFWKPEFNYKICIMNDSSRETGTWTLPNQDIDQINILKRLNEKPLPLPCVFLHPLVKEDYEKLFMGDVGFNVTIPFKDIVEHHKQYLGLKESGRYFTKVKEELLDCRTQAQAERIFEDMVLNYKIPSQSANKIRAEFDTIFDSKMTDISTSGQLPWSTSKNTNASYNPLTACVHAGVLPVLETEFVSNYKQLLSIYFSYFVGDLFNRQKQDLDFLQEKSELLLVIDEAHNISQKGLKSGADMLLRRCVREGRPRRIGTLIATQKFNELPQVIAENTMFLICFKSPGEAPEIVRQYNMGKHMVGTIRDLGKHECIAYSTEHFVVYDSNGKRRKSKLNEVFIGKTLPPYSMHKKPKASGGEKR